VRVWLEQKGCCCAPADSEAVADVQLVHVLSCLRHTACGTGKPCTSPRDTTLLQQPPLRQCLSLGALGCLETPHVPLPACTCRVYVWTN
jgi:hypothetical protein